MQPSIHLIFDGRCEEAFRFYETSLGASSGRVLRYRETPMADTVPPEWQDKIVHGNLTLGGVVLAGADVRGSDYALPQGFFVLVNPADVAEAERVFAALSDQGSVRMPLQKTFWSPAFGVVVDRFGIPWEVNCEPAS